MQSSPAKTRLLTALLLVVIFGAGFTLGLAVHRTAVARPAEGDPEVQPTEPARTPMYERVGPTEDQGVLIDSIVVDFRAKMESLQEQFRSEYNPRYEALIDSTRGAIKDVFNAEQAAQYDSLITDYERRKAQERRDSLQAAGDHRN